MMRKDSVFGIFLICLLMAGCQGARLTGSSEFIDKSSEKTTTTANIDVARKLEMKVASLEVRIKILESRIAALEKGKNAYGKTKAASGVNNTSFYVDPNNGTFPDNGITPPESCLNIFNTYWDGFSGLMEKGKTYRYYNKGFNDKLHFKVVSTDVDNKGVIVYRSDFDDWYGGKYQKLGEDAMFIVLTEQLYAEDVSLKEGLYECIGTHFLERSFRGRTEKKSAYVLREVIEK